MSIVNSQKNTQQKYDELNGIQKTLTDRSINCSNISKAGNSQDLVNGCINFTRTLLIALSGLTQFYNP